MLESKIIEIDEEILLNVENNFDGKNGTQIVLEPGDSIEVLPSKKLEQAKKLREAMRKNKAQAMMDNLKDIIKLKKEEKRKEEKERILKIETRSLRQRNFHLYGCK